MFSTGRALSSQYIYGDFFIHRNSGADMVFQGSNTTDDGSVEFLRYRKADEDVNFSKTSMSIKTKRHTFTKKLVRIVIYLMKIQQVLIISSSSMKTLTGT